MARRREPRAVRARRSPSRDGRGRVVGAWAGRRVLVTGAEGFIGSHLVERLLEEGAHVRAFVQYNPEGTWEWLAGCIEEIEIVAADVRDRDRVLHAVDGTEVVFHLA